MIIGTCKASKGKITSGHLTLVTTKEGVEVNIPVYIACGKKDGKTIFINAGMHGNEINGIELLHRFYGYFVKNNLIKHLAGTIVFLPILNISGYEAVTREVVYDGKDLNRSFNCHENRTISNEMADKFTEAIVEKCDLGLDLHDAGSNNVLLPHIRVYKGTGLTKELGAIFGSDIIEETAGSKPGIMSIETYRLFKKPVFTIEIGGALIIWHQFLDRAVIGIKNILINEGFLSGKIILPERQFVLTQKEREGYRTPLGGIIYIDVALGDAVETGDKLAEIYDPLSLDEMILTADYPGIIFARKMQTRVQKDSIVLSIMQIHKCKKYGIKPAQGIEMIINKESDKIQVIESEVFKRAMTLRIGKI